MEVVYQLGFISLALFLVFLNGFFVNAEFSIVKVRDTRIRQLARSGSRRARTVERIIDKMDEYLSATQLGITLASLGLGWLGEPAFARLFEPVLERLGVAGPALTHTLAAGCAFVLITFLHIVLGELAPKSLAIQKPEASVLWSGPPLVLFYKLSYPFIWSLNGTANLFLKSIGIQPTSEKELAHSEEELRLLLAHSHEQGVLDLEKTRMLQQVFRFGELSVRQVMVPSVDVKFLDTDRTLEENLRTARAVRHTRYPLCRGSLDQVVGIVHVKDLFQKAEQVGPDLDLRSLRREVHFVPENKDLHSLLSDFQRNRVHLAIVVDEFGSTVGMVTMEDVLEELVGEIQDEFDADAPPQLIRRLGDGLYLVQGRALIGEVENQLGVELSDNDNDTIAGHVMLVLGRTAEIGDQLQVGDAYRVRVAGMKGLQITDLYFERLDKPDQT